MDEPPSSPRIIEIRSTSHGRQRMLLLGDGREFFFSDEACGRVHVAEGDLATAELMEALDDAEQRVNAHEAALRLLSNRPRSETEMRTRLAMRGIAPPAIDEEIERLQRAGLLDDAKFAHAWVEDRRRLAPRGVRMLRYELLGRGIEMDSVDQATRDIDDRTTAMDLARDRARKTRATSYEAFAAKVGGFLQRRGFDYDVTAQATRDAWNELQSETASGPDPAMEANA